MNEEKENTKETNQENIEEIYPLLIHIGKEKVDKETKDFVIKKIRDKKEYLKDKKIYFWDINDYEEEHFLESELIGYKMMLLSKAETAEELYTNMKRIINQVIKEDRDEEDKSFTRQILSEIVSKRIGKAKTEELLKLLIV